MIERTPTRDTVLAEAGAAFGRAFDRDPTVLALAPGRVNLIGDHTDYNDGIVLPMAIDRVTVIAAAPSKSPTSRFVSVDLDEEIACELKRDSLCGFARYIVSVARELEAMGWSLPEVEVVIRSTVPIGAGLASSAALVVSATTMFEAIAGQTLTPIQKAKLCQRAEARSGTPCGIMDLFVATHAREGCALLLDCRSLKYQQVALANAHAWLIVNTGVRHALSDGAYAERRATCEMAARMLSVPSLRDATLGQLDALSEREHRRARHVLTENARVLRAAEAMQAHDMRAVGQLMFESHTSLAQDFEVSCAELDAVAKLVRDSVPRLGLGARMTGAGFGGCAVVLCDEEQVELVRGTLEKRLQAIIGPAVAVFRAMPSSACQLGRDAGPP